jgi:hypothetical protein
MDVDVDVNVGRCEEKEEEEETNRFKETIRSRKNSKYLKLLLAHYILLYCIILYYTILWFLLPGNRNLLVGFSI